MTRSAKGTAETSDFSARAFSRHFGTQRNEDVGQHHAVPAIDRPAIIGRPFGALVAAGRLAAIFITESKA